jgi:hypothetical protein
MRFVVEDMPLQTFVFQHNGKACNDTMTIETGASSQRPSRHQIIEPFRVVLTQDDESGRYNELEILAETGKTEITFHPGLEPELVEKLAA